MKYKHKKAFIEQIMLGFFLLATVIILGATVADETEMRTEYYNAIDIAQAATKAASSRYEKNGNNYEDAEEIATNLVASTALGRELIRNGNIHYTWYDKDGDGIPDYVMTRVLNMEYQGFWYKFLGDTIFSIPSVSHVERIRKLLGHNIKYGGHGTGYMDYIGTYELDENGCIINPQFIMVNHFGYKPGVELVKQLSPGSRFFLIADAIWKDGTFLREKVESGELTVNTPITIVNNCPTDSETTDSETTDSETTDSKKPGFIILGREYPDMTLEDPKEINIYFQDAHFNLDNELEHMHIIGKHYYKDYMKFVDGDSNVCASYNILGQCVTYESFDVTKAWADWVQYAKEHDIDFLNDPKDEYVVAMEDMYEGGDKDYNDIYLNTTKIYEEEEPFKPDENVELRNTTPKFE